MTNNSESSDEVALAIGNVFTDNRQISDHLKQSYENAKMQLSSLSDGSLMSAGILNYFGMSGKLTRHFINNLANVSGLRYAEVGTYHGSTLMSALYRNPIHAVCCDNWSQFGGSKDMFNRNMQTYFAFKSIPQTLKVFEADFNNPNIISSEHWANTDFYLFDGPHSEQSQYDGLANYINNMSERFLFMVDDWHWEEVRRGTLRAIRDLNLNVLGSVEIDVEEETRNESGQIINRFQKSEWHNGIAVFACQREINAV